MEGLTEYAEVRTVVRMQEPTVTDAERLWTPADVARYTNRSLTWVRERTADGSLPVVDMAALGERNRDDESKRRRQPLYRPESIKALFESIEQPATRPNPYGRRSRGRAA